MSIDVSPERPAGSGDGVCGGRAGSVGSSVQSKARPKRALPPEPGAGPKATPRTRAPPVGPAPLSSGASSFLRASSRARSKASLRRSAMDTRLASGSDRRGAPIARRRLGGFVIGIVGHDAVPSLDLGLVEAFVDAAQ